MGDEIRPFKIHVSDGDLEDLRKRLRATRWPDPQTWTDCHGNPENALTRDEMLDDIMLYWLPNAAAASARLYWESFNRFNYEPVRIPVGCSIFPKDVLRVSRRWAEKRYTNPVYWNRMDRGGHFAAFEQPDLFVKELRVCFRKIRAI